MRKQKMMAITLAAVNGLNVINPIAAPLIQLAAAVPSDSEFTKLTNEGGGKPLIGCSSGRRMRAIRII